MELIEVVALVMGAVALTALAALAARRTGLPAPVLLVLAGLVYALLPGPNVTLDPEVILGLVIPPLLYSAALTASLLDIRANVRPIALLSVVLVLVTALVVGLVVTALVPDLPLAAGVALGAILAPPDAVAAIVIGRRVGLPRRMLTIIEGEGLINDATALTALLVAVGAVSGGFSLPGATAQLLLAAGGGTAIGLLVAWVIGAIRRRLEEPLVENALSLATPFLAFVPAEELHVSGVLAVVVCGLVLGHQAPRLVSSAARLQSRAVWLLIDFLLEGLVFLLIGQQLPVVLSGLERYPVASLAGISAAVVAAVVLVRPAWVFAETYLPGPLRGRAPVPPWQETAVLSWAGTRGVISLAAAFTLPTSFPQRDLLLFLTFVVVVVTLLGQGLTLAPLARRLGVRSDGRDAMRQAAALHAAIEASLELLDDVVATDPPPEGIADQLVALARARQNAGWERRRAPDDRPEARETPSAAFPRLRHEMIAAERRELLRWRDEGRLDDEGRRELERELDYEEGMLG